MLELDDVFAATRVGKRPAKPAGVGLRAAVSALGSNGTRRVSSIRLSSAAANFRKRSALEGDGATLKQEQAVSALQMAANAQAGRFHEDHRCKITHAGVPGPTESNRHGTSPIHSPIVMRFFQDLHPDWD